MKIVKTQFNECHYKDDGCTILHREDGPAITWVDGVIEYWIEGQLHRENGPAIIWHNNTVEYYIKGKRHREDGPAIIHLGQKEQFYLDDVELSKKDFTIRTKKETCPLNT